VLSENKLDQFVARLETSTRKLLVQLEQQTGVSTPSAQNVTKVLHFVSKEDSYGSLTQ
jgi:hypothetical protein